MNREVHVRFWESPEVKVLRATRQSAVLTEGRRLPVFPDEQTLSQSVGTSHLCQQATLRCLV